MNPLLDQLLLAIIGIDLYVVSTSRLGARIRACALQGLLLAALPLAANAGASQGPSVEAFAATVATLLLKAWLIPRFLRRTLRDTGVQREVEPFVSLHLALLFCAGLVVMSFGIGATLLPPVAHASAMGVPAGLATLLIGLYLTVSSSRGLSQVLGYLVAENGVFVIGLQVLGGFPLVIELGVLLDVLVAAMLMAILFVRASREPAPPETRP